MHGRRTVAAAAIAVVALVAAPAALATGGTPSDICKDLLAHGHLTHHYTQAQLSAYESDTTMQGYCPKIVPQQTSGNSAPPTSGVLGTAKPQSGSSGTLPFTGFRLTIAAIVAFGLLLGGVILFAAGRQRRT